MRNPDVHDGLGDSIVVRALMMTLSGFIVCTCRYFPYFLMIYL